MEIAPPNEGPGTDGPKAPPLVPGTLYLVATPIGNLEDITLRALRVLGGCTVVAAEDTRRTGQLLTHFGLRKPMVSFFRFNEARRGAEILDRLRAGDTVALVSDAGSPGISDPGERLVAEALAAGLRVEPVPGACALVAGLTASGLPTGSFHFAGFLPHKSGQRARELARLGAVPGTLVLYESPFRVERLLGELQRLLPGRRVVLARELTKKFEEWLRGRPPSWPPNGPAGRARASSWSWSALPTGRKRPSGTRPRTRGKSRGRRRRPSRQRHREGGRPGLTPTSGPRINRRA